MFVRKFLISTAVIACMSSESYGTDEGEPQDGPKSPLAVQNAQDFDEDVVPDDVIVLCQSFIVPQANWTDPEIQKLGLVNKQWNRCLRLQTALKFEYVNFPKEKTLVNFLALLRICRN